MIDQNGRPALPAPASQPDGRFMAVPVDWQPGLAYGSDVEAEQPSVPLSHYLWILRRQRWKILTFIGICVAATLIVSERITPVFEATATVDVDRGEELKG